MPTTARLWFTPPRDCDRYLPEGPRVVPGRDEFAWVNIQAGPGATAGNLHLVTRDFRHARVVPLPGRPGFVLPHAIPHTLVVGCDKEVGWYDRYKDDWDPILTIPDADPRTIINDGEVVPGGKAIVFGTKDTRFADPTAHLYLYTVDDRQVSVLAGGMTCSNGKVFAAGGRTLYDIDTPRKVVTEYALDVEKRTLTEKGIALDLRHRPDFPDGMCDAGDGTVIIAFYNPEYADAGRAVRYRLHTGEVLDEWLTPGSPRVTCPLLFDDGGAVKLLLTTADEGMAPDLRGRCPNAGCLFVADTGLSAVPLAGVVRA
jgi:sugar lactone lactonase YvrE